MTAEDRNTNAIYWSDREPPPRRADGLPRRITRPHQPVSAAVSNRRSDRNGKDSAASCGWPISGWRCWRRRRLRPRCSRIGSARTLQLSGSKMKQAVKLGSQKCVLCRERGVGRGQLSNLRTVTIRNSCYVHSGERSGLSTGSFAAGPLCCDEQWPPRPAALRRNATPDRLHRPARRIADRAEHRRRPIPFRRQRWGRRRGPTTG